MKQNITLIDNPTFIDSIFIDSELTKGKTVLIQFSDSNYEMNKLTQINDLCKFYDQNLAIRFYGHYFTKFDCSVVKKIPYVKNLSIDGLKDVENVHALTELENLKVFKLGIYDLKEPEFFQGDNFKQLIELDINSTTSKNLNLQYIRNFKSLKYLTIEEHTKNIEAIGEVSDLEYLCLRSINKKSVEFINNLKKLKTLRFLLGSRENIREIGENEIENLELSWVKGLNDVNNISNFKKIKVVLIEDNIKLPKINFDTELSELTNLTILNCKGLHSLTGIENLTSLTQCIIGKTDIEFDTIIKQKLPPTLKVFEFYTGKKSIDLNVEAILHKKGYMNRHK
jgi:protein phosphatase 1 regulatory subunit 7